MERVPICAQVNSYMTLTFFEVMKQVWAVFSHKRGYSGLRERIYKQKLTMHNAVVVVITPPLPWDGGTARTAIQVHTVNVIEIRLGERWQPISNQ